MSLCLNKPDLRSLISGDFQPVVIWMSSKGSQRLFSRIYLSDSLFANLSSIFTLKLSTSISCSRSALEAARERALLKDANQSALDLHRELPVSKLLIAGLITNLLIFWSSTGSDQNLPQMLPLFLESQVELQKKICWKSCSVMILY